MKLKDYLHSLVSRRRSIGSTSKSEAKLLHNRKQSENATCVDCHYDICGYEEVNTLSADDQRTRTHLLLSRHAELISNIVESRSPSSHENTLSHSSCLQCRLSHFQTACIPPPLPPPPLPPKLSFDGATSFSNRNYSSTLATCSPRRECQQMPPMSVLSSQYSTPNPSMISSSSSLWTNGNNLSKKQRSRIRTNPWIGKTLNPTRPTTFIESDCVSYAHALIPNSNQPEYCLYDPAFRTSPPGLIHSESFPQTMSNGNIQTIASPGPLLAPPPLPTSGICSAVPQSNIVLHRSDSGHGFSLSSSRVIGSSSSSASPPSTSSSPDSTSVDGPLSNDKISHRQRKYRKTNSSISPNSLIDHHSKPSHRTELFFQTNTIATDSLPLAQRTRGYRVSSPSHQYHYQRPTAINKTSPVKSSADRLRHQQHSTSSSSRSIDDHFSLEFEEIVENERSCKQRKDRSSTNRIVSPPAVSSRKSPFILPLEETKIKLSSPSTTLTSGATAFTSKLAKTNSRAILRHIEEIENEIRMIKNLDLDHDEQENDDFVLSPHAYPEEDIEFDLDDDEQQFNPMIEEHKPETIRPSIYEQVDQWVDRCLQTNPKSNNSAARLHDECDQLSKTIKEYVGCICVPDEQSSSPSSPNEPHQTAMTTTTPTVLNSVSDNSIKRASLMNRSLKINSATTVTSALKPVHECPF